MSPYNTSRLELRLIKLVHIWVFKAKLFWQEIATFSQQQWTKAAKCAVLINFFWCILAFKINHNIVPRMQKKTCSFFLYGVYTAWFTTNLKCIVKIHLVILETSSIHKDSILPKTSGSIQEWFLIFIATIHQGLHLITVEDGPKITKS